MFKKLLSVLVMLLPVLAIAQDNKTGIPIPMKNGIVWYEKSYPQPTGVKKQELVHNALNWFKTTFPEGNAVENQDKIEGKGLFKIPAGNEGNYYWMRFNLVISVTDTGYTLQARNFYEKPFKKGISNEFSKIEYRWRDFRKGKPWMGGDDEFIFKGLDADMAALLSSLQHDIALVSTPKFRALAFFSTNVENDHVDFARNAMDFYAKMAAEKSFAFDTTSNWENLNDANLKNYNLVIWLNEFPHNEAERRSFEKFMENGGAWLGFHVSGYNDKDTHWPWFVSFMGGAVFHNNNWPPLPAKMIVDDNKHPVTKHLPKRYTAPINEWYGWKPNPRDNKDVKVLITLSPENYPIGKKNLIKEGDIPVVWTNTKFKMLYMNMGHGDQNFALPLQNKMFEDAILWLGMGK